jgi:hypothetical protein
MARTYDTSIRMSKGQAVALLLGALLILVVPVLIYLHPLMDPALAKVPAVLGLQLLGVAALQQHARRRPLSLRRRTA